MPQFDRVVVLVLDSVGIGMLPDAGEYDDIGAHTLGHVAEVHNGLHLPNLRNMGLGNIEPVEGVFSADLPSAYYGRMSELSKGKDTTTGHWELMGLVTETRFRTYPDGFPAELLQALEERTGRKVIGNLPISGTKIINDLGEEHMRTGSLIVYTSADSVLQIAAHEDVIPVEELYRICEIARELTLDEEYAVVRVIARPFTGSPGNFERTIRRKDYSVKPPANTVLNHLAERGYDVIGIGKIDDIFAGEGITNAVPSSSNMDGVDKLLTVLEEPFSGLAFVNLVDFDSKYGHRRDPVGYAHALEEFDERLPEILTRLRENDLLVITADHGNDPTYGGTDHTREYVPLLVYGHSLAEIGQNLGVRKTFADVGATIAHNFQVQAPKQGTSLLHVLERRR